MPTSKSSYRTTPDLTDKMPGGIPYIVGNEAAERFSFYGMRAILFVFMTEHLLDANGELAPMDATTATIWQHKFMAWSYYLPIVGAILSDWLFGKYRTILWLSFAYCIGHAAMALVDFPLATGLAPQNMLFVALACLAIGAGGIKPCVSAHVGDQFGPHNKALLPQVYRWFYFSINLGAAASMILTPRLLHNFGPGVAFGVPGVLMAIATFVFWLGRNKFVHIPPAGNALWRDIASPVGRRAVLNLIPLYLFIVMFWCLFDQTQSRWVEQAKSMDRTIELFNFLPFIGTFELIPSEIQALNSFLVLALIPLFNFVIYPWMGKFFQVTPLRRVGVGLFTTVLAFVVPSLVQMNIDAGGEPHIAWQFLAYLIITAAEVMVSITALEFSYTQAPKSMKSFIMGLFLLSVALGNEFTVFVNEWIKAKEEAGSVVLSGAAYYWFFTGAMLLSAILFVIWSQFYKGQTYIQGEAEEAAPAVD